jgi:glyoxylase-like metal-dependent hydrolase (beta-lactamase superfamily II)
VATALASKHRRREPAAGVFRLVLPLPFPGLSKVNAYLLADERAPTVVDCGIYNPHSAGDHGWEDLVGALAACDAIPGQIGRLIVTHPHVDHYGMAARLVEDSGCELWMHRLASLDLDVYRDPGAATRQAKELLADHGVDERELDELSAFEDWRPFVSSVLDASVELEDG